VRAGGEVFFFMVLIARPLWDCRRRYAAWACSWFIGSWAFSS